MVIESVIEQLWTALENAQEILEELSAFYVEIGDESGKNETFDETETIKKEVEKAIETGQNAIKVRASKTVNINKSLWENTTDSDEQPTRRHQENENHGNHDHRNRFLKPLRIPTFDVDKRKFEDFWVLFRSLVDESTEPSNLKMARLRQCLTIPRYPYLVHTGASMERKKRFLLRRRQQPKEILGNRKIRHGPRRQTCTHRRRETGSK